MNFQAFYPLNLSVGRLPGKYYLTFDYQPTLWNDYQMARLLAKCLAKLPQMKVALQLAIKEEKTVVEEVRHDKMAKRQSILELAPISRLSNELLGLIFVFASATRQPYGRLSVHFNFSHVSQRWRSVALGNFKFGLPYHFTIKNGHILPWNDRSRPTCWWK